MQRGKVLRFDLYRRSVRDKPPDFFNLGIGDRDTSVSPVGQPVEFAQFLNVAVPLLLSLATIRLLIYILRIGFVGVSPVC